MLRVLAVAVSIGLFSGCTCGDRTVQVTGDLHVEPSALDFGVLRPGQVRSLELHLENVGKVGLAVAAQSPTPPFEIEPPGLPLQPGPGESRVVQLTARAVTVGHFASTLTLTSEAEPVEVALVVEVTEQGEVDAGPGDAGPGDAGPGDAGPGDAGPGDAGPGDAGPGDAGPGDAGTRDAGPTWLQLSASRDGTCVRTAAGTVDCWGTLTVGRNADGTPLENVSSVPRPLPGVANVAEVAAGADHLCLLFFDGGIGCQGAPVPLGAMPAPSTAYDGGMRNIAPVPAGVVSLVASGRNTCVLTAQGEVWCWGDDVLTGGVRSESPQKLDGLPAGVSAIFGSLNDACALTGAGELWCWGFTDVGAPLGFGSPADGGYWVLEPRRVTALDAGLATLALEDDHACGILFDGGMVCWGRNGCGQLGNGQTGGTTFTQGPQPVPLGGVAVGVSVRPGNSVAMVAGGTLSCWGCSQPGDGTLNGSPTPVPMALARVRQVVASSFGGHTCAASDGGAVWCWGDGLSGQLGRGGPLSNQNPSPGRVVGY